MNATPGSGSLLANSSRAHWAATPVYVPPVIVSIGSPVRSA